MLGASMAVAAIALVGCSATPATPEETSTGSPDSAAWDEIVAAAEAEGSVTIYSSQIPTILTDSAAAFMEEYPNIQVNAVRMTFGDLMTRYDAELSAGAETADLLETPLGAAAFSNPEWFADLDDTMPNLAEYSADSIVDDKVVALNGFPYIIAFNTDKIDKKDIPTTWEGLTDPEFKGVGVLTDPRTSAAYTSWAYLMDETYGDDYLKALGNQGWGLVDSGVTAAQQVAAGAYELAAPVVPTHLTELLAQGAPIDFVMPTPVHLSFQDTGVTAEASHPNAAKVFLNWYMGEEGQKIACNYDMIATLPSLLNVCQAKLPDEYLVGTVDITADQKTKMWELLKLQ